MSDDSANELGHVFRCSDQAIERIGLGENLLPTDQGVFVGAETGGVAGFGVPSGINALSREAGNFACGDTVIFQAISSSSVPGGVRIQSFVLTDNDQPDNFTGPDMFRNLDAVLEQGVPQNP